MSKSAVAGISGSVRIQRLSGVALSAAEAHGKRLDNTGKVRSISNDPVITTTGLDLNKLYETHVSGALIHKSSTKALHMVLQYPTNLVSGDGANSMLFHARRFAKSVFGDNAIFADRVDRDEKSRHVVDLFIAPKHRKDYKIDKNGKIPPSRQKVSTSKDLKALAEKFGRAPTLRGQGQALQDAWFDYLKGIGLGVQRGQAKKRPGDDWLSPEELEIDRKKYALKKKEQELLLLEKSLGQVASNLQTEKNENIEDKRRLSVVNSSLKDRIAAIEEREKKTAAEAIEIENAYQRLKSQQIEFLKCKKIHEVKEDSLKSGQILLQDKLYDLNAKEIYLSDKEDEIKDALFIYNSFINLGIENKRPITKILYDVLVNIKNSSLSNEYKVNTKEFFYKLMDITKKIDIYRGYNFKNNTKNLDKEIER